MILRNIQKLLLAFAGVFFLLSGYGQTLIMNEVSQGSSGTSEEYVEFIVVDTTAVYDCDSGEPPCIDIRGWIIDDNSGYHDNSGVAAGACRFSFDPLWSCVPLGTIIVIYNDAQPNPTLGGDDTSLSDGNCSLTVPISDPNLIESNTTTPGAIACSYPSTGWTPGGSWTKIVMANGGDCFRLVDLNGCEVFSVCYEDAGLNNLIYFDGGYVSTTSATQTVYYFNDGDPNVQANWSMGCSDVTTCGVQDQTPGAPNNAANAAYIAQFNNGCTPIPPIVASATSVDGCGCTGSASASGSGSIPGYSYEWYDDTFTPIGQSTANATGLCPGTYNVIVTSSIDCPDTAQVILNGTLPDDPGTNGALDTCVSLTGNVNLFDYLGGTPDNTGTWTGPSGTTGAYLGTIDLSSASAGTYTYTVGTSPCTSTAEIVLSYTSLPVVTALGTDITCSGSNNGSIDASVTGTGPYTYSWDNGIGTGAFHTGLGPNTYTVTVIDGNGCINTDAITIVEPTPLTATIAPVTVSCNGACDGAATVSPGGGSGSYTYSWDNSTADNTATTQANLCASTYNVTVADAADATCSTTANVTVTEPSIISLSETNTPANCGVADGTATITASGGSGTYTNYNWSPAPGGGQGSATATGLSAGIYSVTVTDNNNCTATISVTISNNSAPSISEVIASHVDVSCNGYSDGSAEVSVSGGAAPLNVSWSPSGGTTNNASGLSAGTYTVTVTDNNLCTNTVTIDITEPTALTITSSGTDAHCSQADGTLTTLASGGTPTYTYNWYTDASLSSSAGSGSSLSNLLAGTYYLETIDGNGCTILDNVTIADLAGPTVSAVVNADATNAVSCDGDATASVTGGTGNITYLWDNGNSSANATDLCVGNNCVIATDAFGCPDTTCVMIMNATGINLTLVGIDPSCNDACDGSIDATVTNAILPVSYSWSSGQSTEDLTGICAGNYVLTVTDGIGETATAPVTLINPDTISIQTNTLTDVSCFGSCDGIIDVNTSGGTGSLGITWTDASSNTIGTSNSISSLCSGSYSLNITDANGCAFDTTYIITEPAVLTSSTSASSSNCSMADGGVSVIANGGTISSSYIFEWTDVSNSVVGTTANVNNIIAGTYYVSITDDNGCNATDSAIVNDINPNITIAEDSTDVSCYGGANGTIDLTISSPNSYVVSWTGPNGFSSSLENLTSLSIGPYDYTLVDINGCEVDGQVIIEEPTQLILALDIDSTSCDVACDGSITATATGGVSPYSFSSDFPGWTNGAPNLCIGSYQISVTDDNGCTASTPATVFNQDNRPDPTILLTDFDYCLDEPSFTITAKDPNGIWASNGSGFTDPVSGTFSPSTAGVGTEQITYTFPGVCGDADTIDINIHQLEDASFTAVTSICENDPATILSPVNAGGQWQGNGINSANQTFDPNQLAPGIYDITYIMPGQCPDTVVHQIEVIEFQDPVIDNVSALCLDDGNIQLTASIPGGVWSGASNASGIINTNNLGVGTFDAYYALQVQCSGSDTIEITINDLPVLNISVSDTLGCVPMTVNISDLNSQAGNVYNWNLDGVSVSSNESDVLVIEEDDCQELSASVTDGNGCVNSAIYPSLICTELNPISYFEYTPDNPTTYDFLVNVSNMSSYASSYTWMIDGTPYSSDYNILLNFNGEEPNDYYVCLTSMNYLGCTDTYCDTISITDEFALFVPNTFTPDGNGNNETFGPIINGDLPEEADFMIFNRWGELIFETNNLNLFWDGTYLGNPSAEDVYIWKINYKVPNTNKRETKVGHVTLIR